MLTGMNGREGGRERGRPVSSESLTFYHSGWAVARHLGHGWAGHASALHNDSGSCSAGDNHPPVPRTAAVQNPF